MGRVDGLNAKEVHSKPLLLGPLPKATKFKARHKEHNGFKEMEVAMIMANMEEDREATMIKFLSRRGSSRRRVSLR